MSETRFDLIVLGAGPGGYVAAERAGALGLRVLLIEAAHLGGVCLNEGCVPSKTLLNSSKVYAQARHGETFGVTCSGVSLDLPAVIARKDKIIKQLRAGIAYQMKRHHVTVVEGRGAFIGPGRIQVGETAYEGANVIVATGSSAVRPPIPGADLPHVITSREMLCRTELPKRLAIIGGGVIGMEFASFASDLGVEVVVIEMLPEIVPNFDDDIAQGLRKALDGVTYHLGAKVTAITPTEVQFEQAGQSQAIAADLVLMAVGRSPNTRGLGLETIGVDVDRRGIKVDDQMRTNIPGVYAIGDVTGRMQLAHTASRMGEVAVNTIAGRPDRMRWHAVPWVVYTHPEVAGVGLTEREAAQQQRPVKVSKLPFKANGRFLAEHDSRAPGFLKALVDPASEVLLGVHMLGGAGSEIIYGAAAMIEAELRVRDIREIIFPHPTMGELLRDALWELH
jgi:dihydrolipoamide dehydrogenase